MGIWSVTNLLFLRHLNLRSKQTLFNTPFRPLFKYAFLSSLPSSAPAISSIALRFLSANTSSCYAYDFDHKYASDSTEEEETGKISVKAYFLSTSIDLKSMQAANLSNVIPATSRSSNYIALRYCDYSAEIYGVGVEESANFCRYMVVFQYGSAVLFNVSDDEVETYLEIVRRHASGLLSEVRRDDYAIKEKKLLAEDMKGGPDYIVLKKLDADGIRIIGSVLGQSIALDYFVSQVDGMVEEFTDINRDMEKRGTFTMERKKLFQLVGKANSNLADVILKVGLFDRSEIAWRDAKYSQILEYLREEYEFTQRFGNLVFKLKFVEISLDTEGCTEIKS